MLIIEAMPDIGVTRISRWIHNCYILRGDDGPVVVDAGLPGVVSDLQAPLAGCPGRLKAVIATHAHSDHVAGAPRLAQESGAPIYLPARSLPYLDGLRPRTPSVAKTAAIWPTLIDQPFDLHAVTGLVRGSSIAGYGTPSGMKWTGPAPAGGLEDRQTLPGASQWTVIAAPGHTDDSIALWNAETRTLLSGDAALSAKGRAWLTPEVVDPDAAHTTNEHLTSLPVAHLLPGHGRPVHAADVWGERRR